MSNVPLYLKNYSAVTAAFGYWPSFHDSHVLEFSRAGDELTLVLHAFEMTNKTDARGYFELVKHHRVTFRFALAEGEDIQPPKEGNTLLDLEFLSGEDGVFVVELISAIEPHLCSNFRALNGEVVSVVPCNASGDI